MTEDYLWRKQTEVIRKEMIDSDQFIIRTADVGQDVGDYYNCGRNVPSTCYFHAKGFM